MSIKSFLKSDGYLNGIIIALIIPCVSVLVFIPIGRLIMTSFRMTNLFDSNLLLLCLIPNLLIMRYFMVKAKLEKSGRAILGITVIMMACFFVFIHGKPFNLPF